MTRSGVADHLNRVAKYVASRTLDDPGWAGLGWAGTTILRGGNRLTQEIEELTTQDGLVIVLTGSISLSHDLFRANLVDEVRLFVNPLVLDDGRRMFPQGWNVAELGLVEERRFSGGVVLLRYLLRH